MTAPQDGTTKVTDEEIDRQCTEAEARQQRKTAAGRTAVAAHFDERTSTILVSLSTGWILGIPIVALWRTLEDLTINDIREVRVTPEGDGICWPVQDIQVSILGLLAKQLGLKAPGDAS